MIECKNYKHNKLNAKLQRKTHFARNNSINYI